MGGTETQYFGWKIWRGETIWKT